MRIELPLPLKVSTNKMYGGMHWAARKELADLFHGELIQYRNERIETPCELEFHFTFAKAPLDSSNCSFLGKMYEDSLVKWGILPEDNWKEVKSVKYASTKGVKDKVTIISKPYKLDTTA